MDNSETSSSEIHIKVEPADWDKVATDEAEFSKTLLEVTLKRVSEGDINLGETQILIASVHFFEDADALKATGTRESLRRIRNHYVGLDCEFHYLATATLTPEQLRKVLTDLLLPAPAMSTHLTHAIMHHDDDGAC